VELACQLVDAGILTVQVQILSAPNTKESIMNKQLQEFARSELKSGLHMLSKKNQSFFKRMYSHKNPNATIDTVVDSMPVDKLDWAMQQVQNTLNQKKVKGKRSENNT